MTLFSPSRTCLALAISLAACTTSSIGQTTQPPSAPSQTAPAANCPASDSSQGTAKPCPSTKKTSPAEEFPFPGAPETPPNSGASQATPDAPSATPNSGTTPADAAKEHPFPGIPPATHADDDSSSGSSSSSSSSGSADDPDAAPTPRDTGAEGTSVHRKLPKPVHVQSDDERVDEDLKVAKFYMHDDNLPGAYLRAKDAVKVQPEYSEAHFALAEVAEKMKKKDEAVAEYQTYLKLDPQGERAKAAKRALDDLK